jgi:hypothetical protein
VNLGDYLDFSNDILIEVPQIPGGYPVLLTDGTTHGADLHAEKIKGHALRSQ